MQSEIERGLIEGNTENLFSEILIAIAAGYGKML